MKTGDLKLEDRLCWILEKNRLNTDATQDVKIHCFSVNQRKKVCKGLDRAVLGMERDQNSSAIAPAYGRKSNICPNANGINLLRLRPFQIQNPQPKIRNRA